MFGSQTACPEIGSSLLWWIPVTQEEAQGVNFDTYHQIGGVENSLRKSVGSVTSCDKLFRLIVYGLYNRILLIESQV